MITRTPSDEAEIDSFGGGERRFPNEYSISGWFRWD